MARDSTPPTASVRRKIKRGGAGTHRAARRQVWRTGPPIVSEALMYPQRQVGNFGKWAQYRGFLLQEFPWFAA